MPGDHKSGRAKAKKKNELIDRLSDFIPKVMQLWLERVRKELPAAKAYDKNELYDTLPVFLTEIAKDLSLEAEEQRTGVQTRASVRHGEARARLGDYPIEQALAEYRLLREAIFEVLEQEAPIPPKQRHTIQKALDLGINVSAAAFVHIQFLIQQTTIDFLDFISRVSDDIDTAPNFSIGLSRLLRGFHREFEPKVTTILAYNSQDKIFDSGRTIGLTEPLASNYIEALVSSNFAPQAIEARNLVYAADSNAIDSKLGALHRQLGIRSVLRVKLVSRGRLLALVCFGFESEQHLSTLELTRLQTLAQRFAL